MNSHSTKDGAKAHIDNSNAEFLEELKNRGVNAEGITQLVNSLDTNLLDLVFFMWCNLQMRKLPKERVR